MKLVPFCSTITALLLSVSPLQAIVVNLISDNTSGIGGENWHQANDWDNNATPTAGNDYHVGNSTGKLVQALGTAPTFGGSSLTLHTTGSLGMRTSSPVVSNLILDGGTVNHQLSGTITLGGSFLTVNSLSTMTASNSSDDGRDLTINSVLAGSGGLSLVGFSTLNTFRFNGVSSSYSGTMNVTTGTLWGSGAGSLGNASLVMGASSRLDLSYNYLSTTASLTLNTDSTMSLTNNLTFGAVTIGGSSLAQGTYSFATLNATYDAFFVDGGTGTITVVPEPEPSAFGALLAVGLGLVRIRRRK